MILDSGICSFFERISVTEAGHKPTYSYALKHQSWYKNIDFVTSPRWATNDRKDINVSLKIRVAQNEHICEHDKVVLSDVTTLTDGVAVYDVVRIYHTTDAENGERVCDVSLEVLK